MLWIQLAIAARFCERLIRFRVEFSELFLGKGSGFAFRPDIFSEATQDR